LGQTFYLGTVPFKKWDTHAVEKELNFGKAKTCAKSGIHQFEQTNQKRVLYGIFKLISNSPFKKN